MYVIKRRRQEYRVTAEPIYGEINIYDKMDLEWRFCIGGVEKIVSNVEKINAGDIFLNFTIRPS